MEVFPGCKSAGCRDDYPMTWHRLPGFLPTAARIATSFLAVSLMAMGAERDDIPTGSQGEDGVWEFGATDIPSLPPGARIQLAAGLPASIVMTGSNWISLDFTPTRTGRYQLEIDGGSTSSRPVQISLEFGTNQWKTTLPPAADGIVAPTVAAGYFSVLEEKATSLVIQVTPTTLKSEAIFYGFRFLPTPEGPIDPPSIDGVLSLPASAATTHSTRMRYEAAPHKNCLGYWTNPKDWASWEFPAPPAGPYDIEVWQGCGRDQGGSEIEVTLAGQAFLHRVEETGHFQNFIPRRIGRATLTGSSNMTLALRPQTKAASAIMDVQRFDLYRPIPVHLPPYRYSTGLEPNGSWFWATASPTTDAGYRLSRPGFASNFRVQQWRF